MVNITKKDCRRLLLLTTEQLDNYLDILQVAGKMVNLDDMFRISKKVKIVNDNGTLVPSINEHSELPVVVDNVFDYIFKIYANGNTVDAVADILYSDIMRKQISEDLNADKPVAVTDNSKVKEVAYSNALKDYKANQELDSRVIEDKLDKNNTNKVEDEPTLEEQTTEVVNEQPIVEEQPTELVEEPVTNVSNNEVSEQPQSLINNFVSKPTEATPIVEEPVTNEVVTENTEPEPTETKEQSLLGNFGNPMEEALPNTFEEQDNNNGSLLGNFGTVEEQPTNTTIEQPITNTFEEQDNSNNGSLLGNFQKQDSGIPLFNNDNVDTNESDTNEFDDNSMFTEANHDNSILGNFGNTLNEDVSNTVNEGVSNNLENNSGSLLGNFNNNVQDEFGAFKNEVTDNIDNTVSDVQEGSGSLLGGFTNKVEDSVDTLKGNVAEKVDDIKEQGGSLLDNFR